MPRFTITPRERGFLLRLAETDGPTSAEAVHGVLIRRTLLGDLVGRLAALGLLSAGAGVVSLTPRGWLAVWSGEYEYPFTATPPGAEIRSTLPALRRAVEALTRVTAPPATDRLPKAEVKPVGRRSK